jgi:hypothetical protein
MSHEIVKAVKNINGKLIFKWASNNVHPRTYHWSSEYTPEAIADSITGGSLVFQCNTKLAEAIKDLQEKYNWRNVYEKYQDFKSEKYQEAERANINAFAIELTKLVEAK